MVWKAHVLNIFSATGLKRKDKVCLWGQMVKTSEGETVKGPELFLESQEKLLLSRNILCVSLFLFVVPLRLFPSHLSAQWEKSHECTSLYWVNSWLTLGLVSMPPNKSLVCVSWQNSTLKPLRKQLFINVWLRHLCVRTHEPRDLFYLFQPVRKGVIINFLHKSSQSIKSVLGRWIICVIMRD